MNTYFYKQIISIIHAEIRLVYVGVAFGNDIARDLYYSMGFRETGEKDKVQLEMRLEISRE